MSPGIYEQIANTSPGRFAAQNAAAAFAPQQAEANLAQTRQQTAGLALNQEIQRQQLQDSQVIRRAYINTSGDPDEMRQYMVQNGISGQGLMAWQQHSYDMALKGQQLTDAQRKALEDRHEQAGNVLDGIRQNENDPVKLQNSYADNLTQLKKLAPDVNWVDPQQFDRGHLYLYNGALGHAKAVLEQTKAQQEIAGTTRSQGIAALSGVVDKDGKPVNQAAFEKIVGDHPELNLTKDSTPEQIQAAIRGGVAPAQQPEYDIKSLQAHMGMFGNTEFDQFKLAYAASKGKTPLQLSPQEAIEAFGQYAASKADPQMRALALSMKGIQEATLRLQQQSQPNDADIQQLAQGLISHRMAPSQFREIFGGLGGGMAGVTRQRILLAAQHLDPTFNWERADSEFKTLEATEKAFTDGKQGDLARANNNALEHLGLLDQAVDALKNNDIQLMNRVANYFGVQTGGSAKTTFDLIGSRVGEEVTKSFIPGGGGEIERLMGAKDFSSEKSPTQLKDNIKASIRLMDSQQKNLEAQYKRGTYGAGVQQLFTPEAMATRDRLLGGGAIVYHIPGDPRTFNIPANQEADFLKDHPNAQK